MAVGVYYDLQVDYETQLQNEFVKSVGNTNVVDGISCARYWSIILKFSYEKEGIMVLDNEEIAQFSMIHFPKTVEDDVDIFPTVACILNSMLRKVDHVHPVSLNYLKKINPDIKIEFLLSPTTSPSKTKKGSKKITTESTSKALPTKAEKVLKPTPKMKVHTEPPLIVAHKPDSKPN